MHAPREEALHGPRAERAVQEFQHRLAVDLHVVAVGHEDPTSGERHQLRRGVDLDSALAREVVADPHVVVPGEESHTDAAVGQLGELAQRADKPFGDHPPVFEPEIEDVAYEKDRLRIAGRSVEPRHEPSFHTPGRGFVAGAEVHVGSEIDHNPVSSCSFASSSLPRMSRATISPSLSMRKLAGIFCTL